MTENKGFKSTPNLNYNTLSRKGKKPRISIQFSEIERDFLDTENFKDNLQYTETKLNGNQDSNLKDVSSILSDSPRPPPAKYEDVPPGPISADSSVESADGSEILDKNNTKLLDMEVVYRKKVSHFQNATKRAQLIFNALSILAIVLNSCGAIVGVSSPKKSMGLENKIALGLLSGFGILIQTFLKLYEYEKKIYFRKIAVIQYTQGPLKC